MTMQTFEELEKQLVHTELLLHATTRERDEARQRAERAEAEREELRAMLGECVTFPYTIDRATVAKAGINAAPEQVVLEVSMSYVWREAARALLARIGKDGAA